MNWLYLLWLVPVAVAACILLKEARQKRRMLQRDYYAYYYEAEDPDAALLQIYLPPEACNWQSDGLLNAGGELMECLGYELEMQESPVTESQH